VAVTATVAVSACGSARPGPAKPGSARPGPVATIAASPIQVGSSASCAGLTPRRQYADARIVVIGSMLSGPTVRLDGRGVLTSPARMRVARYLKGTGPSVVTVRTGVSKSGNRVTVTEDAIEPAAGQRWRIYSNSRHQPLETSICAGSRRFG
jgi:hypothetical protein